MALTAKQQRGLAHLLAEPSIATAARAARINERTMRRWLEEPEFERAYRAGRRRLIDTVLARLQATGDEAVQALARNLHSEKDSVQVSAAKAIIEQLVKVGELLDLADRVAELEARNDAEKSLGSS